MARKRPAETTFDQAIDWLKSHGFDVAGAPNAPGASGNSGQMLVKKHGCAVILARGPKSSIAIGHHPSCLVAGEMATLVDRGYQKFLKTSRLEVPATSDHLLALHKFQSELAEAIGHDLVYNLALGTVSDEYLYDRLKGRADIQP
jgi:hypothetical protein